MSRQPSQGYVVVHPPHGQRWSLLVPGATDTVQPGCPVAVPKGLYPRQHRVGANVSSPEAHALPLSPLLERLSPAKMQGQSRGVWAGMRGQACPRVSVGSCIVTAPCIAQFKQLEHLTIAFYLQPYHSSIEQNSVGGRSLRVPARLAGCPARRRQPVRPAHLLARAYRPVPPFLGAHPLNPTSRLEGQLGTPQIAGSSPPSGQPRYGTLGIHRVRVKPTAKVRRLISRA